jgi:hypothetical protein
MPSIEEETRSQLHRALVVHKLCDACAISASQGYDFADRDEGFWNGLAEIQQDLVSFLERLPRLLPSRIINQEMPPAGDPFYESPEEDA